MIEAPLKPFENSPFYKKREVFYKSFLEHKSEDYFKIDLFEKKIGSFQVITKSVDTFQEIGKKELEFGDEIFFNEGDFYKVNTNSSNFLLSFFEKGLKVIPSKESGYLNIVSDAPLALEPLIVNFDRDCQLIIHYLGKNLSTSLDYLRVIVNDGVKAKLYLLFEGGRRVIDFSSMVGVSSKLEVYSLNLKSDEILFISNHNLNKENSAYVEKSVASLKDKSKLKQITLINEEKEGINVDVESRAILDGNSRCQIKGTLMVKKGATGSDSKYSAHCLKLSQNSKADVEPQLEIEALNVKATHSASVSKIDDEKIFYIESRGIERERAKKEIGIGFLSTFIKENNFLQNKVEESFYE